MIGTPRSKHFRAMRWVELFAAASVVATCLFATVSFADEYSTISQSTVLGRTTGIPTGIATAFLPEQTPDEDIGRVDFVTEAAFYFKNMELFGLEEVEGETLFGVLLPLRFQYRADARLQFEVGAILGADYGDDERVNVTEPLVRLTYAPKTDLFLVAGTIHPTHWIHDALVDDTNKLRGRAEQGVQLRIDRARFKQDIWANWRIRETGVRAEEFEIAAANQLRLIDNVLWLDAQGIWSHAGGQISSDSRLEHSLGFLVGASLGTGRRSGFVTIDDARLFGRYLYSIESGRGIDRDTGSGWEIAAATTLPLGKTTRGRIHASYFAGHGLEAERGDPLYLIDDYIQLGGSLLFRPLPGLGIETGILGQWTDDELNFTYTVNFVWGQGFATPIRAIPVAPVAPAVR